MTDDTRIQDASRDDIAVADEAYARFCRGFSEGAWDDFFALVADEVDFSWPAEPGAGRFAGVDGRRQMEDRFRRFGGDSRITDITVIGRSVVGDTVFFEDDSSGVIEGEPYHALHCVVFTVRDGALVRFREYIAQPGAAAA